MADVAIICGSASDAAIAEKAKKVLDEQKITYDYQVISAHRDYNDVPPVRGTYRGTLSRRMEVEVEISSAGER